MKKENNRGKEKEKERKADILANILHSRPFFI